MPDFTSFEDAASQVAAAASRGDRADALAMLHARGRALATEGGAAYRDLVKSIPESWWGDDPFVIASLGLSYSAAGTEPSTAGLGYVRAAEAAVSADATASASTAVSVALDHAAVLRTLGRLDEALDVVHTAQRRLESDVALTLRERMQLEARASLAIAVDALERGTNDRALEAVSSAIALGESGFIRADLVEALGIAAMAETSKARFNAALARAEQMREVAEGTTLLQSRFAFLGLAAEAMVATERGDFAAVARALPGMERSARQSQWEPFARVVEAHSLGLQGRPIEALDALEGVEQAYARWKPPAMGLMLAVSVRAGMLIVMDQGEEAQTLLAAHPANEDHLYCPNRLLARLALLAGDVPRADALLRSCEELGEAHSPFTLPDVQLLRAAVEHERDNFRVSDVVFDRTVLRMARSGNRAPIRIVPSNIAHDLLARASSRQQPDQAADFVAELREWVDGPGQRIEPLSARERLVLEQVQKGLTVSGIARALYISPNTVKTHLRRLYKKLGVNSREDAVRRARALGVDLNVTRHSPGDHSAGPQSEVL